MHLYTTGARSVGRYRCSPQVPSGAGTAAARGLRGQAEAGGRTGEAARGAAQSARQGAGSEQGHRDTER